MEYRSIPTTLGRAKLEQAALLGVRLELALVEFGDGGGAEYEPTGLETALRGKVFEAAPNTIFKAEEAETWVEIQAVIPFDEGGWWLREYGVRDVAGDLIFVGNLPQSFKPVGSSGAVKDVAFELLFDIQNADSVTLKIDPAKVLATRKYVDDYVAAVLSKQDAKNSVRAASTGPVVLSGLQTHDGVALVDGDRFLAKDQAAGKDNGIYIVRAGAWVRATDADESAEVTPGMWMHVEQGTVHGDAVWQLVTNAPIVLGTTSLVFEVVVGRVGTLGTYRSVTVDKLGRVIAGTNPTTLAGYGITDAAPKASPALTGAPTAPTPAPGTNTTQLATAAFVQAAIAALLDSSPAALDTLNELAAALGNDPNFATTMTNALAGKQPLDATLTALAALSTAANKLIYSTGSDQFATADLTAKARALLASADEAAMRAFLGLVKQINKDDTTAGSVLTVGAGGLLGVASVIVDWDAATDSTRFIMAAPGAIGAPLAVGWFIGRYEKHGSGASDFGVQYATQFTGSPAGQARKFFRVRSAAGWHAWQEDWNSGNFNPATKADLVSPVLTGTPTAPTAAPGTNTTQLANTAFVQAALAALVASSPAALDTLNELAAALGNDPNFATTMTSALAAKAPLASPALTGAPTAPTAAQGTATTQIANAAFVRAAALGLDQAWQDVRASRAGGTTYTNTTGKPIMVTLGSGAHLNSTFTYTLNGLTVTWSHSGSTTAIHDAASFIVPNGGTYSVSALPAVWLELR